MFQLSAEEFAPLRSQFATLNDAGQPAGRGRHRKYLPYAFTEHGAIMAASVLNSPRAIEVSMYVVRAFVRLPSGTARAVCQALPQCIAKGNGSDATSYAHGRARSSGAGCSLVVAGRPVSGKVPKRRYAVSRLRRRQLREEAPRASLLSC
jgi:hypothetical protein